MDDCKKNTKEYRLLNKVQKSAFDLIKSDAKFIYTLIQANSSINSTFNCVMMSQPYIGLFADGVEQWCRKVKLNSPVFNVTEKEYYKLLRLSHKLFEKNYNDYVSLLSEKYNESDKYFYSIRSFCEKLFGYYNVGTDLFNGEFCGNTILCSMYVPINCLGTNAGIFLKNISIIAGKLAAFVNGSDMNSFDVDNHNYSFAYKDYHFYNDCPLKKCDMLSFVLFSILCSVNFVLEFVDKYFIEEIPQKFKFAYLQYYYLCDFIQDLNRKNNIDFYLNVSLVNTDFRNCLAHYGLGQYMNEEDIIDEDVLKGLTVKAFDMDYYSTKKLLYKYLSELVVQIKEYIF